MNDDELPPTDDDTLAPTPEATTDGATTDAPPTDDAPAGTDPDPNDGPDSGPLADAPPVVDDRPREVIRGIHAELVCTCPECDPYFVELQWFSPEEQKKVKGDVMLFCARSSRKYFTPMIELQAWIAENGGPRKARRGGGGGGGD